jgi:hypothetical protein
MIMAWTTGKISNIQKNNGIASVTVVFVNDSNSDTFNRSFPLDGNPENLKRQIQNSLDQANAVEEQTSGITTDVPINTTPSIPLVSDLTQFVKDVQALARLKRLVDLGVFAPDDKKFTDLLSKVKSEYQDDFEFKAMI